MQNSKVKVTKKVDLKPDFAIKDRKVSGRRGKGVWCASAHSAKNDLDMAPPLRWKSVFRGSLLATTDGTRSVIGGRRYQSRSSPPLSV